LKTMPVSGGLSSAGFSLRVLIVAQAKTHRLKPVLQNPRTQGFLGTAQWQLGSSANDPLTSMEFRNRLQLEILARV
jgi:hypothetical protein